MNKSRRYSELIEIPTFEDRFEYLSIKGKVGTETFGFERYLNQKFYRSIEWKSVRDYVITRDMGCDLAVQDRQIQGKIYIHHMIPISAEDIERSERILLDPEYLVCVSHDTHNAIHYGTAELLSRDPIIRRPGDTCPWKRG